MRAVALHLLVGGYSAENDFGKLAAFERPVGNATVKRLAICPAAMELANEPDNFHILLYYCHRQVSPIVHQSSDVVFRHLR